LALYKSQDELLITLKMSYDEKSKNTILRFITKDKNQALLVGDAKMLKSIIESIKSVIPKIQWGISGYF